MFSGTWIIQQHSFYWAEACGSVIFCDQKWLNISNFMFQTK